MPQETTSRPAQRGKDGHLTLNNKGGGDFFSSGGETTKTSGGGSKAAGGGLLVAGASVAPRPALGAPPTAAESKLAQNKFANAKAISSRDFQNVGYRDEANCM